MPSKKPRRALYIDWKIAGLNALGLIFFFVPGVVAYVVDFAPARFTFRLRLMASFHVRDPNRSRPGPRLFHS